MNCPMKKLLMETTATAATATAANDYRRHDYRPERLHEPPCERQ